MVLVARASPPHQAIRSSMASISSGGTVTRTSFSVSLVTTTSFSVSFVITTVSFSAGAVGQQPARAAPAAVRALMRKKSRRLNFFWLTSILLNLL